MIGIDGQYAIMIQLGDSGNEISEGMFQSAKLIVEAGLSLPQFELDFMSPSEEVFPAIEEGQFLTLGIGPDAESLTTLELIITRVITHRIGQDKRWYTLRGASNHFAFWRDSQVFATDEMSGIEAMLYAARLQFETDPDPDRSDDQQRWWCPGWPLKRFMHHCWMHSFLKDSVPVVGINERGQFMVRDMAKLFSSAKGTMGPLAEDNPVIGNYVVDDQSGFVSAWGSNGQMFGELDMQTTPEGVGGDPVADPGDRLLSDMLDPESDFPLSTSSPELSRFLGMAPLCENMHENYWRASLKNTIHLTRRSGMKIRCGMKNRLPKVGLLDAVQFLDPAADGQGTTQQVSGVYAVTRVCYAVGSKDLRVILDLSREPLKDYVSAE